MVAVISVMSQVAIPTPSMIPLTLQVYVIALTGYLLGWKRSLIAVIVYVALGFIGAPVFASFQGGASALFGYTGGFIIGFIPLAAMCGISKRKHINLILGIVGVLICHTVGVLWYTYMSGNFISAILLVSLPYLPKDIIFTVLAYFVADKLKRKINFL